MVKGPAKGKIFEREIASTLSKWSGLPWRRVPSSGALRWKGNTTWTYGDVLPPENWPLVVECKHHHELSIDDVFNASKNRSEKALLLKWWYNQLQADVSRCKAELNLEHVDGIVVWKKDYGRAKMCFSTRLFSRLCWLKISVHNLMLVLTINVPGHEQFYLSDFEDFLGVVSPSVFFKAITFTPESF